MSWEPFIGPSQEAMRTLLIRPIQHYGKLLSLVPQTPGWGSQTPSIYPTYVHGGLLVFCVFYS